MSDYVSREDHEDRVAQINAHRMDLQDRIEAQAAEIARLNETVRRVQAAARTLETTRCEIYQHYVESSKINAAAVSTLDSEREANALLTADIEAQAADIKRLRDALRPFAKAAELMQPEDTGDWWAYRPAGGDEYGISGRDLRNARAALGGNDE